MKKSLVILFAATIALSACNKEQKGKGGLLYTVHKDAGKPKIKEGDFVKIDFIQKNDRDSIVDASYDHLQSRIFPVGKKLYAGDMNDVLTLFGEGDSVTFKLNIDTAYFYTKEPRPEQLKNDKYLIFTVKVQKVFAKNANEADSTFQKRANDFFTKDYNADIEAKKKGETAKMKKYAEDNNLKVTTTPSGLQYVIVTPGSGPKPVMGDTAIVDYTGQFTHKKVSGKLNVFDTSVEKIGKENMAPNPMKTYAPVPIPLSEGIAKGFVEALQLIGKGGKITAIMPSKLGYGEQGGGPIGPYSPLVFDIEIKDIKKEVAPKAQATVPVAPATN
ncbi:MAG: peptidylprolyl isomerase [Pedobacter sp.]|nr:MAG: peptidylprolyl isomerase [Pedobacter sp.]